MHPIERMDQTKGAGPDGIPPPLFIKECSRSLVPPLLAIYNASLRSGIFPVQWKVIPIF